MATVLLDSSVFLQYLLTGPKYQKSREIVEQVLSNKMKAIISAIAILEIKYHVLQEKGHEKAEEAMFLIQQSVNLEIVDITDKIAERAADLRFKYFDRVKKPLSFADSLHVATAIQKNCSKILSTDSDFKDIKEIRTEIY